MAKVILFLSIIDKLRSKMVAAKTLISGISCLVLFFFAAACSLPSAAAAAAAATATHTKEAEKPNVILILADDLGKTNPHSALFLSASF